MQLRGSTITALIVSVVLLSVPLSFSLSQAEIGQKVFPSGNQNFYSPDMSAATSTVPVGHVVHSINVGQWPDNLVYDPVNNNIYATIEHDRNVSEISSWSNKVVTNVAVLGQPIGIVCDEQNGNLYVVEPGSNNVSVINAQTDSVIATIPVGYNPLSPLYVPANGFVYIPNWASQNISVINTTTNKVVKSISLTILPVTLAYDPENGMLYVSAPDSGAIDVLNVTDNRLVTTISVTKSFSDYQMFLYNPITGNMYLSDSLTNRLMVINSTTNEIVWNTSVGVSPGGMTFDPANNLVYVPNFGSDNVTVIDAKSNQIVGTINVGSEPTYSVFDPSNGYIYVANWNAKNVSVIGESYSNSTYSVIFKESGLENGMSWGVSLNGIPQVTNSSYITFYQPSGTFGYEITNLTNYSARPSTGVIHDLTITGKNVTIPITFRKGSTGNYLNLESLLIIGAVVAVVLVISVAFVYRSKKGGK